MPRQHPRTVRPARNAIARYLVWMDSWDLAERAAGRKEKTRVGRTEDLKFFAGWLTRHRPTYRDWTNVDKLAVREFFAWLQQGGTPCPHTLVDGAQAAATCGGYSVAYVRHVAQSTALFYEWLAEEDDLPNPLDGVELPSGPQLGKNVPQVHQAEEIALLVKDAEKGKDFQSRRDAALIRLFACTGARLAEMAGMELGAVNIARREVQVMGKGSKERVLRFDDRAAIALDRYLRARARLEGVSMRPGAALWVGRIRATGPEGMTASGIRQAIQRRGKRLGIHTFPHKWRHTFSHRWLDNGGSEGDLMELNGWDSPQMLRHYGAAARATRARRHYDVIDVMGGI